MRTHLATVPLQRAAAHQIRRVEAHWHPPLRLRVPCHCSTHRETNTKQQQSASARQFLRKPSRAPLLRWMRSRQEEENEASPSVSRSVSLLCRSRSRSELTDAVAAACFSLSSATDAMATASGFARRRGLRGNLVGSAHGEVIPTATVRVRAAPTEKEAAGGRRCETRRQRWLRRGETDQSERDGSKLDWMGGFAVRSMTCGPRRGECPVDVAADWVGSTGPVTVETSHLPDFSLFYYCL
jgi:hypothetical protein